MARIDCEIRAATAHLSPGAEREGSEDGAASSGRGPLRSTMRARAVGCDGPGFETPGGACRFRSETDPGLPSRTGTCCTLTVRTGLRRCTTKASFFRQSVRDCSIQLETA